MPYRSRVSYRLYPGGIIHKGGSSKSVDEPFNEPYRDPGSPNVR